MTAGAVRAFAPGRVNLIGEHTDYNGGLCLPFAIERGVTVAARPADGPEIEARALDLGQSDRFRAGDTAGGDGAGWRAFVRGVVGELRRGGVEVPGARLEISGDLPRGAGLGSSAALSISLCLALLELAAGSRALDRLEVARLCARVENDWVGAPTGLMDQLASLFGQPARASRIDMRGPAIEPVSLDLGRWRLALIDSGGRREITASGYERRRAECERACRELGVEALREASHRQVSALPPMLCRRARHVATENERVDAAVEALRRDDVAALGGLLDASHASLRDDYEVSTPAVEAAIGHARASGAAGARIHGGGFGGQILALLPPTTPLPPCAAEVTPAAGARLLAAGERR